MLRSGRTIFGFDHDLPTLHHFRHAKFRWCRWFVLQVSSHDIDLFFGQIARSTPVGHASGRTVGDQGFEIIAAFFTCDIRSQRFTGGAFAQHAMTTGTALKIDLGGNIKLVWVMFGPSESMNMWRPHR